MITVSKVFQSVPPLFSHLSSVITGDIDCSNLALKSHSVDGSTFSVLPQAVLYPKTTSDVKHAIAFAREYHIPLTVAGGMSAGSGGALGEGVIIDMTRYFNHIRHMNMLEQTVTVDAGVAIDDLIDRLDSWNMEIPVLQKDHGRGTIGGLVATKSASASTFHAGTIREWIEGMTVVVDSGEEHHIRDGITPSGRLLGIYQSVFPLITEHSPILRASRREQSDDATGYCLWNTSIGPRQLLDQLVGSEGTLAIITSITFRVVQKKRHTMNLVVPVSGMSLLATYTDIAKHHGAERLFMFDAAYRKLLDTFHPNFLDENLAHTPFSLIVTFRHDDEHMLENCAKTFVRALPEKNAVMMPLVEEKTAQLLSSSFLHSLFARYTKGSHMVSTAGEGIIVPLHQYASCLSSIDETLGITGQLYTLTGFIGSGHVAATTSFDSQSLSYEKNLEEYREKLFSIASEYRAGISAVGGDGLERTNGLPFIFNEATRSVFKTNKEAWDPYSIFNPSKKISISKDYLREHATRFLT